MRAADLLLGYGVVAGVPALLLAAFLGGVAIGAREPSAARARRR